MALQINKATPIGVTATYHRIGEIRAYPRYGHIEIVVDSFPDKATRDGDADPLASAMFTITDAAGFDNGRAGLYDALKALPQWAGASDV